MPILSFRAKVQCDGCAKTFYADADTGHRISQYAVDRKWTLHDYAEDAVRGGHAENGEGELIGSSSVQGEHLLCPTCTEIVDDRCPEGKLTHEQVSKALNEKAGV